MRRLGWLGALLLCVGGCAKAKVDTAGDAGVCVHGGETYANGATVMVDCNACTCTDGALQCDTAVCMDASGGDGASIDGSALDADKDASADEDAGLDGQDGRRCMVDGLSYPNGAQDVPDTDSCNLCTCEDGTVTGCTERFCPLPACHVAFDVDWIVTSGSDPNRFYRVGRDNVFQRTLNLLEGACSSNLPECGSPDIDAEEINAVLRHPDVGAALRDNQVFGDPHTDTTWLNVTVAGHHVGIAVHCSGACGLPPGVAALRELIAELMDQQHCATPTECRLPVEAGPCLNIGVERFHYDLATDTCLPFSYHCGGNANRFTTEAQCLASCEGPPPLPFDT